MNVTPGIRRDLCYVFFVAFRQVLDQVVVPAGQVDRLLDLVGQRVFVEKRRDHPPQLQFGLRRMRLEVGAKACEPLGRHDRAQHVIGAFEGGAARHADHPPHHLAPDQRGVLVAPDHEFRARQGRADPRDHVRPQHIARIDAAHELAELHAPDAAEALGDEGRGIAQGEVDFDLVVGKELPQRPHLHHRQPIELPRLEDPHRIADEGRVAHHQPVDRRRSLARIVEDRVEQDVAGVGGRGRTGKAEDRLVDQLAIAGEAGDRDPLRPERPGVQHQRLHELVAIGEIRADVKDDLHGSGPARSGPALGCRCFATL